MNRKLSIISLCFCLILCGCITEYEPTGVEELADILVVEGIITDDETTITLSRSLSLSGESGYSSSSPLYVDNAEVYVECDDGTQFLADLFAISRNGKYTIKTGKLNPERKYRLKIEIEEMDYNSGDCQLDVWGGITCPTKTCEYSSDFAYPIITPEIDSIFWTKRGRGQPVNIHVATHSPNFEVLYYRWSYKEDWEVNSTYYLVNYPFYCWGSGGSRELLLGSAEKTVFGRVMDRLIEMSPSDRKLSVLYRIDVKQNVISKRAYDYFANIKKNAELSGSIFAPVPSELRGNITCTTDQDRPVIGYVDISTTTQKLRYIRSWEVYERPRSDCDLVPRDSLLKWYNGEIPDHYVVYPEPPPSAPVETYVPIQCVDCSYYATARKPDDWPNN